MTNSDPDIVTIPLANFGGRVIIGRNKGEVARKKAGIEQTLASNKRLRLVVAEDVYALNSSFLLGLLGPEMRKAGTKDAFLEVVEFEATSAQWSEFLDDSLEEAIEHARFKTAEI